MRKQLLRQMKRGQESSAQSQMQQVMQEQMARMQELAGLEVEGAAGQGAVRVRVNGQREPLSVKIDRSVIDPEDPELLEDLVLSAFKDGLAKAQGLEQEQVQKMAGGLLPPGMGLPGLL